VLGVGVAMPVVKREREEEREGGGERGRLG